MLCMDNWREYICVVCILIHTMYNIYTHIYTAQTIYSVAQERAIEGMLC